MVDGKSSCFSGCPTCRMRHLRVAAWSNRGGPEGTNITFNYGSNASFGAVGHWGAPDMGWAGPAPAADQWHHLTYTYDAADAVVFEDGVTRLMGLLVTVAGVAGSVAAIRRGRARR